MWPWPRPRFMFLQFPTEIKLEVFAHLHVKDVLSLKQTCRGLHALGCRDDVWHQIIFGLSLPLDLPPNQDVSSLGYVQLQPLVMKALRLEHTWQSPPRLPRYVRKISHNGSVVAMRSLGTDWLVIAIDLDGLSYLCIHSAKDKACHRITGFNSVYDFCTSLETASQATIVVRCDGPQDSNQVLIYSVSLPLGGACSAQLQHAVTSADVQGSLLDAHICGNLVAIQVRRTTNEGHHPPISSILFINTDTNARWFFPIEEWHPHLEYQIFPERIVLIGNTVTPTLVVSVYSLPSSITRKQRINTLDNPDDISDTATLVFRHETDRFSEHYDFYTVVDPTFLTSGPVPVITFPRPGRKLGHVLTFPIEGTHSNREITLKPFKFKEGKTIVFAICVGNSGRRAVWLEYRREYRGFLYGRYHDDFELIKASFSRDGTTNTEALLPPDIFLPFKLQDCNRVAFSEAGGHIYLSTLAGELYAIGLL